MAERLWLDVLFEEKDEAKAAGARYDPATKCWYAPRAGIPELERWALRPPIPTLLPGEDRSFGTGLFVDLVPSSCWFTNVRSCVDKRDWNRLRTMIYSRAGNLCEACGASRDNQTSRYLEAHERWDYDDATATQTLRRLICLCTACHSATHYGLARIRGKSSEASAHLRAVTGLSTPSINRHIDGAFATWKRRSGHAWTLDLSMLTDAGIRLAPPPDAADRGKIAHAQLRTDPTG